MNGYILIVVILLQFSCYNQEQSKPLQAQKLSQVDKKETSTKQKFTTGISAIFQDSKGNYWFGSHGDGLCMFDGQKFNYFTVENGLMTPTLKVKRRELRDRLGDVISALYDEEAADSTTR